MALPTERGNDGAERGNDGAETGLTFAKEHMSLCQHVPEWSEFTDLPCK